MSIEPTAAPLPLEAMLRDAETAASLIREGPTWDLYGDLCGHVRVLVDRVRELEGLIEGHQQTLVFALDVLGRQSKFWSDPILARLVLNIEQCLAGPDRPANPEETEP